MIAPVLLRCGVASTTVYMLLSFASVAHAQQLTNIGVTSVGTPVMLEARSVSRANGIVTATVRAVLQPPIKTPKGDFNSTRSTVRDHWPVWRSPISAVRVDSSLLLAERPDCCSAASSSAPVAVANPPNSGTCKVAP